MSARAYVCQRERGSERVRKRENRVCMYVPGVNTCTHYYLSGVQVCVCVYA